MIRALLALGLVLAPGCARKGPASVDHLLPEATADIPAEPPRQVLEEGAAHLDPTPRALALGWLIRLEPPGSRTWSDRALFDPSAWVQRAGVEALAGRLDEHGVVEALEEYVALGQADPYTRASAGIRLAGPGSEPARRALSAAWRAESEAWLIAPLALAAAAHGDEDALAACGDALATGEIGLELAFLREVGASGHPELQEPLRKGMEWAEEELQLPYAVALVQLGDPSGEQALRKALQDADPTVRYGVVDLLVDLDHPTAMALLQKARADETQLVRWYARLAIAARAGGDIDGYDKAFEDADPEVRALAVRLVARATSNAAAAPGRKEIRQAERLIIAGLADPESSVRLEALRAAALLDLRASTAIVAGLTRDPWVHLRIEAAGAALALGYTGA